MKTTPVRGTNDYLPREAALRDRMQETILKTYRSAGFLRVQTPAMEDLENLSKSDGGDNLNLMFKILKRGDKLDRALETLPPADASAAREDALCDMGLRYDLTLPLCRVYAGNREKLPNPFKVIQIDKAYRAERPQKGRLREFVQCDIDILGSDSPLCEVELIDTTTRALLNLGMEDFSVRINDRRLLRTYLTAAGFAPDTLDSVCISFDKLDKIGPDGVKEELSEKGFPAEAIENLVSTLVNPPASPQELAERFPDPETASAMAPALESLTTILDTVGVLSEGKFAIRFDLSLVRGQGYYTGTVFEVESNRFRGAIAGGGRYDNLVGKFIGAKVPAVGFSIGFERIFSILLESGADFTDRPRAAVLYRDEDFIPAMQWARELRETRDVSLFRMPKKLGSFLSRLTEQGYSSFAVFGRDEELRPMQ
ncbi:MAG: histidine--tRNA ligase [Clostridia bacterium]|nr:histidine--tRNA ligase [Clostridia bacterium]